MATATVTGPLAAGQLFKVAVVVTRPGSIGSSALVDPGDGSDAPSAHVASTQCGSDGGRWQGDPELALRTPGLHHLQITATSTGLGDPRPTCAQHSITATFDLDVVVGAGPDRTNGPRPPTATFLQTTAVRSGAAPAACCGGSARVDARDPDGRLARLVVHWANGRTDVVEATDPCVDDHRSWPASRLESPPDDGQQPSLHVRVEIVSTDCDGGHPVTTVQELG